MSDHHRIRLQAPKHPGSDNHNFNPTHALESLHTEVVQLEVFAHLAGEVTTRLSPRANREQRREFIRLYALVTKVAEDAAAIVGHGDALIAALSAHLTARRNPQPGVASADR
jgi:hypothetical protein